MQNLDICLTILRFALFGPRDPPTKRLISVMIRTVDTDVLNLALSLFKNLKLEKLWMDFGSEK